jgi:hypothetical protein
MVRLRLEAVAQVAAVHLPLAQVRELQAHRTQVAVAVLVRTVPLQHLAQVAQVSLF